MHEQRKQLKLDEDPWDNYLYYDSAQLVPLVCHAQPLAIAEQVVLARFIEYSVRTQSIA